MNMHDAIMNIQANKRFQNKAIDYAMKQHRTYHEILVSVYQMGHRDARHAAAELAVEADIEIEAYERDQCGCCDHVKVKN